MKDVMTFLNAIVKNNNRPWFQEHKDLYLKAQDTIHKMAEELITGISKFDASIKKPQRRQQPPQQSGEVCGMRN